MRCLRALHAAGYVHNDLKPSNMLLSRRSTTQPSPITLIDFGLCTRVEGHAAPAPTGAAAPPWRALASGPKGTPLFASVAADEGRSTCPADDIESLAFNLAYLAAGSLQSEGAASRLAWHPPAGQRAKQADRQPTRQPASQPARQPASQPRGG